MHPDLIYTTRQLQQADLYAEAAQEQQVRQAATKATRSRQRAGLWHWLIAWFGRPSRSAYNSHAE